LKGIHLLFFYPDLFALRLPDLTRRNYNLKREYNLTIERWLAAIILVFYLFVAGTAGFILASGGVGSRITIASTPLFSLKGIYFSPTILRRMVLQATSHRSDATQYLRDEVMTLRHIF